MASRDTLVQPKRQTKLVLTKCIMEHFPIQQLRPQLRPCHYITISQNYPFQKIESQTYSLIKLQKFVYTSRQDFESKLSKDHKNMLVNNLQQKQNQGQGQNINLVKTFLINQHKKRMQMQQSKNSQIIPNLNRILQIMQKMRTPNLIKFNVQNYDFSKSDRQNFSLILNYEIVNKSLKKYIFQLPTKKHAQIFIKETYKSIKQLALQMIIHEIQITTPSLDNIGVQKFQKIGQRQKQKLVGNEKQRQKFLIQDILLSNPFLFEYDKPKIYVDLAHCKYIPASEKSYLKTLSNIDSKLEAQCWPKLLQLLMDYAKQFPEKTQQRVSRSRTPVKENSLLRVLQQTKRTNNQNSKAKKRNRPSTPRKIYQVDTILEEKDQQDRSFENSTEKTLKKISIKSIKPINQSQKIRQAIKQKNLFKIYKQQQQAQLPQQSLSSTQNSQANCKNEATFCISRIGKYRQSQPISQKQQLILNFTQIDQNTRTGYLNASFNDQYRTVNCSDLLNQSTSSILSNKSPIQNRVSDLMNKSMKTLDSFRSKYSLSKQKNYKSSLVKTEDKFNKVQKQIVLPLQIQKAKHYQSIKLRVLDRKK